MRSYKLYFGWDYYNYSLDVDIEEIIREKFPDFRPTGIYPNDSDTLPLTDSTYELTNDWHQLITTLERYNGNVEIIHKDTTELIQQNIPFIYLIGIKSGPQIWGRGDRNKLFHNIKQHTKNYIKDGKVLVIVDMSGEGYPVENLDELTLSETGDIPSTPIAIERACTREDFPFDKVCYLTGNAQAVNFKKSKIKAITMVNSEIRLKYQKNPNMNPTWTEDKFNEIFEYKKKNYRRPTTKYFLSLCKLVKDWRLYHSLGLNYYNLHEKGLTSLIIPQNELVVLNEREFIDEDVDDFEFNKNIKDFKEYIRVIKLKLRLIGNTEHGKFVKSNDNIQSLLKKIPLYVDLKSFEEEDGTPISGFTAWNSSFYNDSFFSYLYESYAYNNKTNYVTEKFWKTVLNFHPTILVTNPYTLRYLKERGYKTFSPYIHEFYDEVEEFDIRSEMLLKEVNRLCDMRKIELLDWYASQSETLIYNFKKYVIEDPIVDAVNEIKKIYKLL
jgi:hypothetical protein